MARDAWKEFEQSGKVSDYLAYRQCGRDVHEARDEEGAKRLKRGMDGYGTGCSFAWDGFKSNADWRL